MMDLDNIKITNYVVVDNKLEEIPKEVIDLSKNLLGIKKTINNTVK